MQNLTYSFPAQAAVARAAHVGVVASGDLEILVQPPDAGHPALGRALHLGYFLGYANWNYFTTPFLFSYPGLVANEIEPWHEAGQTWRRLQVRFPSSIATHNPEQVFYFDSTGLQRRMDYVTEVLGSTLVAHYSSQQPVPILRRTRGCHPSTDLSTQPRQHRQSEPAVHHARHPQRRAVLRQRTGPAVTPVNTAVNHPSRRLIVHLPHPYDEARELYEILVPEVDMARFGQMANWQATLELAEINAPHGFMRYYRSDVTAAMAGSASFWKATQYLMGNHTIAERMFHHDPAVMLHAPLRTLIYADPDGDTKLAVDQPSLLFHSYDSPDVAKVGCRLDYLISLLIINMGGDLPSELRHTS